MPLNTIDSGELGRWVQLHDSLVEADKEFHIRKANNIFINDEDRYNTIKPLTKKLNTLVFDALKIDKTEQYLIEDLVHRRLLFNQGKLNQQLMNSPESGLQQP